MLKTHKETTESREGSIVSGRTLEEYRQDLFFEQELLEDKKILNLGAGASNLNSDLKKEGINCSVIDLDLNHDPYTNKVIRPIRTQVANLISSIMHGESKKTELIRKIMKTGDRKMVQGDMMSLPFKDREFDFVFALWSTYQLPVKKRAEAFGEMLRVADYIHVGPILQDDLYSFYDLVNSEGKFSDFEIVLSYPAPHPMLDKRRFVIKEEADYQKIINGELGEDRIYLPPEKEVTYRKRLMGGSSARLKYRFTIILRRKPKNKSN